MATGGAGEQAEAAGGGGPALVTAVSPDRAPRATRVRRGIGVAGLVAIVGVLALAVTDVERTPRGRARVIATSSTTDRIGVQVLDAPGGVIGDLSWPDEPRPVVGDVVEVELVGPCDCLPRRPQRSAGEPILARIGASFLWLPLLVAVGAVTRRRLVRLVRAADGTRSAGGAGPPIRLTPVLVGSTMRVREWWHVEDADGGGSHGWVSIAYEQAFDPSVAFTMHGGGATGAPVAFTSVDGRQLVLPVSTLRGSPGAAHRLSTITHELAGRGVGGPTPDLQAAGQVSVRRVATLGQAVLVATLCASALVALAGGRLPLVAIALGPLAMWFGLSRLVLVRPSRVAFGALAAVVRSKTGLAPRDASWVARVLVLSGVGTPNPVEEAAPGDGPAVALPWPYAPAPADPSGPRLATAPFSSASRSPLLDPPAAPPGPLAPRRSTERSPGPGPTPRFPPPAS